MTTPEKTQENLRVAFLDNAAMETTGKYLARGRSLKNQADDDLQALWLQAFKSWFHNRTAESERTMEDAQSEIGLRGLTPTEEGIKPELEQIRNELLAMGPGNPGVQDAIRRFIESLNEPPN